MLVLHNITKKYQKKVINNFSYCFNRGQIYGIVGKSGSGKSTILSIIAGINKKYDGNVYYNSVNIKDMKYYSFRHVGYISQRYQLFDNLSVMDNITLKNTIENTNSSNISLKAKMYLKMFHLEQIEDKKVSKLSGGQKQRISFIKEIVRLPDILLLDEPTSALDDENTNIMFDILNENKKDMIIIMVTHNKKLASRCDTIIDISTTKSIKKDVIPKTKYQEKELKLTNFKSFRKKVFSGRKILNYIATSIMSLGLLSIMLSNMLKTFIKEVINDNFKYLNMDGYMTYKEIDNIEKIDFKNEDLSKYDAIYYEGIDTKAKENIKNNNIIDYVDFNYYDIENVNFIYDNYLSKYEDSYITLAIPEEALKQKEANNYINVCFIDGTSISIYIDNIVISDDDNFYLYCNNYDYLNMYFIKNEITVPKRSFIYSKSIDQLYEYLNNSSRYKNYLFSLDRDNKLLEIHDIQYSRLTKESKEKMFDDKEYEYYIESDFVHNYIDYATGITYLIGEDYQIQAIIDNSIDDNKVNITSSIADKSINFGDNITIDKVIRNDNQELAFINSNTYNNMNNDITFVGLIKSNNIDNTDNIMVNRHLFSKDDFKAISYITTFFMIFGYIMTMFAIVSSIIVFRINFIKKQKEMLLLINLGIPTNYVNKLVMQDPIVNIISSLFSSLVGIVLSKFLIEFLYLQIFKQDIVLSFSIVNIVLTLLLPSIIIIIVLIISIYLFYRKYGFK